jgi:hypothetical protein
MAHISAWQDLFCTNAVHNLVEQKASGSVTTRTSPTLCKMPLAQNNLMGAAAWGQSIDNMQMPLFMYTLVAWNSRSLHTVVG